MVTEEKLVDFLEKYAKFLYNERKSHQEKLDTVNSADYQTFKNDMKITMEVPLNLLRISKDCLDDERDLAPLLYLSLPQHFKAYPERRNFKDIKKRRNFLLTYFNLTSKDLYNRVKRLEGRLERKYGEDWVAKAYFPSAY